MVTTTPKMEHNAHKVTYLVEKYPEHTLEQIIALLQMPSIDINAAIYVAVANGYIEEPDKETGQMKLLEAPEKYNFGPEEADLEHLLVYCFPKLAEKEIDLEENYLSQWTAGYSSQDTLIALKHLEELQMLAQYVIEDGENAYTFFTLYENRDKLWGRKQFKNNPLPEADAEVAPEGDE